MSNWSTYMHSHSSTRKMVVFDANQEKNIKINRHRRTGSDLNSYPPRETLVGACQECCIVVGGNAF